MTLYDSIWQIFLKRPNAWLTARRIKTILKDEYGVVECNSFFSRVLRDVQDNCKTEDGVTIKLFPSMGKNLYSLTNNKYPTLMHNARLKRRIKQMTKRLIA